METRTISQQQRQQQRESFSSSSTCHHHHVQQQSPGERGLLLGLLRRILKRDSVDITEKDPTLKVIYLGNVVTTWAKTEGCLERPASALWRNHSNGRGSIKMTVTVTPSGLKAHTAEHGLTEYWANRLTWTGVPADYPKLFCWIYRHEGRKLKQELRCHAVLCPTHERASSLATSLKNRLAEALFDFRREKLLRQNARLSIVQSLYPTNYCGHLHSQNYKPPPEKARSAPKLTSIEESSIEDTDESSFQLSSPDNNNHHNSSNNHHHHHCSYEEEEEEEEEEDEDELLPVSEHEEGAEPCSSLNLPTLNCYSKVMLHLLELPPMSSENGGGVVGGGGVGVGGGGGGGGTGGGTGGGVGGRVAGGGGGGVGGPEYPGSSNSDPVNDSSDSDSHDEFPGHPHHHSHSHHHHHHPEEELNDDNVSDESGYSEETVDPILSGNSNNNNNNNNKSKPQQTVNQQPLVLFDNLSFQI